VKSTPFIVNYSSGLLGYAIDDQDLNLSKEAFTKLFQEKSQRESFQFFGRSKIDNPNEKIYFFYMSEAKVTKQILTEKLHQVINTVDQSSPNKPIYHALMVTKEHAARKIREVLAQSVMIDLNIDC
jgi:glutamyl/glutaminyl-tRNA synthetase